MHTYINIYIICASYMYYTCLAQVCSAVWTEPVAVVHLSALSLLPPGAGAYVLRGEFDWPPGHECLRHQALYARGKFKAGVSLKENNKSKQIC